jgi:hypothetical protein
MTARYILRLLATIVFAVAAIAPAVPTLGGAPLLPIGLCLWCASGLVPGPLPQQ